MDLKVLRRVFGCSVPILCLMSVQTPATGQDIHEAVRVGNVAAVELLLSASPQRAKSLDDQHRTPLHVAADLGNADMLRAILEVTQEVDVHSADGYTALQLAVLSGNPQGVEILLTNGADPNLPNAQTGLTGVDLAFQEECRGRSRMIGLLLSRGGEFNVNRFMWRGMNALDLAVESGNVDMVRFLVERGADVNDTPYPASPLGWAAMSGHTEIAAILVAAGADVNAPDPLGGSPLRWAVERGHVDIALNLLDNDADASYVDPSEGRNLLHWASLAGQPVLVRALLDVELDANALDGRGRTALDYATRYAHTAVVETLEASGATRGVGPTPSPGSAFNVWAALEEREAVAWYLANRGWAVKTRSHFLVFDAEEFGVTRPHSPSLANGFLSSEELAQREVIAFYTTYHGATGEPALVHYLEDSLPSITYVHNGNDGFRGSEKSIYLVPGDTAVIGEVRIQASEVRQNGSMIGFLVEVDGLSIYYSGFRAQNPTRYAAELDVLRERVGSVDLAFLPIPEPGEEESEFAVFLQVLGPKAVLLLDPDRREELFPIVAAKVGEWGFSARVFAAENPGDAFEFSNP